MYETNLELIKFWSQMDDFKVLYIKKKFSLIFSKDMQNGDRYS